MVFSGKRVEKGLPPPWTLIVLALLLIPATASGDGGTLRLRTLPEELAGRGWSPEGEHLESSRTASVSLAGGAPEDVHVFEPEQGPPIRILVPVSRPHRIACDVNGDGEYAKNEITSDRGTHPNVRLPYPLRSDVPSITVDLQVVSYYRNQRLYVHRITSVYEGGITIGGREQRARLVFDSPFPKGDLVNETVILDSDGNSSFDRVNDTWFSSSGIAYLEGGLWTVQTTFHEDKAEVSLVPYTGPTGFLNVEGEGLHWLSARRLPGVESDAPAERGFAIRLPGGAETAFALPPGEYEVSKVWLMPSTSRGLYYRSLDVKEPLEATVTAGATASVQAGGPLRGEVKLGSRFVSRTVSFEFEGCSNAAGIEFEPLRHSRFGMVRPSEGPSFEIVNAAGTAVGSGSFDYG